MVNCTCILNLCKIHSTPSWRSWYWCIFWTREPMVVNDISSSDNDAVEEDDSDIVLDDIVMNKVIKRSSLPMYFKKENLQSWSAGARVFEEFSLPQHGRPLFTAAALNPWRCKNNNIFFILVNLLFNIFYCFIIEILPLLLPCHCHVGCNNLFVQVSMLAHRGDSSGGPQHQPQYEVRSFYFMWKLKSTSDFNLDWSLDNCSWLGFRRWRGPNGSGLLINSMWSILKPKLLLS